MEEGRPVVGQKRRSKVRPPAASSHPTVHQPTPKPLNSKPWTPNPELQTPKAAARLVDAPHPRPRALAAPVGGGRLGQQRLEGRPRGAQCDYAEGLHQQPAGGLGFRGHSGTPRGSRGFCGVGRFLAVGAFGGGRFGAAALGVCEHCGGLRNQGGRLSGASKSNRPPPPSTLCLPLPWPRPPRAAPPPPTSR